MIKNTNKELIVFDGIEKWCDGYTLSDGGSFLILCCVGGNTYTWSQFEEIEKEYGLLFVNCHDFGSVVNYIFRVSPVTQLKRRE